MATYDSLTQEQKDTIAEGERWLRGTVSSLVAYADVSDFNLKEQYYNDNVLPLLNTLDPGEIIPNSSGLAGATDITEANMKAAMAWVFGIQSDIDTNLALVIKLIGINANGG